MTICKAMEGGEQGYRDNSEGKSTRNQGVRNWREEHGRIQGRQEERCSEDCEKSCCELRPYIIISMELGKRMDNWGNNSTNDMREKKENENEKLVLDIKP